MPRRKRWHGGMINEVVKDRMIDREEPKRKTHIPKNAEVLLNCEKKP